MSDTNLPGDETPDRPKDPTAPEQRSPLEPGSSAQPPRSMEPPTIQPPAAPQQPPAASQPPAAPEFSSAAQFPDSAQPASAGASGQEPTTALPATGAQAGAVEAGQSAPGAPVPPAPPAPPQGGQYYAAPAGQPAPGQQAPMNVLAIVSFVGSFFVSLVGIICGHIALGQIKKTGERGRGFALAGTIIGYVALAATIVAIVLATVFIGAAAKSTLEGLDDIAHYSHENPEPTAPQTTEPEAGAESGTAEGGKSSEFCEAINAYLMDQSGDLGARVEEIAAFPGPNQELYEKSVRVFDDVEYSLTEEGEALMDEFMAAYSVDWSNCQ